MHDFLTLDFAYNDKDCEVGALAIDEDNEIDFSEAAVYDKCFHVTC